MANSAARASILQDLLKEAGIPVDGISVNDINASPVDVTVNYNQSATPEQVLLGETIALTFDWRKRRPIARSTVVTAFNQLTAAQRTNIQAHLLAELLRNNPSLATQINAALGTSLTVDEVDPT